jgi:hypothetical protein
VLLLRDLQFLNRWEAQLIWWSSVLDSSLVRSRLIWSSVPDSILVRSHLLRSSVLDSSLVRSHLLQSSVLSSSLKRSHWRWFGNFTSILLVKRIMALGYISTTAGSSMF